MKMKEVNGPEEIQARLDRFIDAVDHELDHSHHDISFSPHAVDSISRVEQERGPDQHKSTTGSAHHVPAHATGQLSYFTSLLLTFAASTSVVLLLLWLFWPAADDILERMPDIREPPQLALPSQTFATTPSTDEPLSEGDNAEADQPSVATTSPSVDQPGGISPANSEAVTARQQQTESLTPVSSDKV